MSMRGAICIIIPGIYFAEFCHIIYYVFLFLEPKTTVTVAEKEQGKEDSRSQFLPACFFNDF